MLNRPKNNVVENAKKGAAFGGALGLFTGVGIAAMGQGGTAAPKNALSYGVRFTIGGPTLVGAVTVAAVAAGVTVVKNKLTGPRKK